MPDSSRVTDRLSAWVNAAIEKHSQGEEVAFEFSLVLMPDGMPITLLAFWMQSGVVGASIPLTLTINNPLALTEEEVDSFVANSIEQIRQRRTQFLAAQEQAAQAQADTQNGHHQQPPQGLVLPSGLPPV